MADRRIYRYSLPLDDAPVIGLPEDAQVLSVAPDRGGEASIDLWALVDTTSPVEPCGFRIIGTGNPIDESPLGRFIGTVSMLGGRFIAHVFQDGA